MWTGRALGKHLTVLTVKIFISKNHFVYIRDYVFNILIESVYKWFSYSNIDINNNKINDKKKCYHKMKLLDATANYGKSA